MSERQRKRIPANAMIGIVGWKKSGKTTLSVRLISEFTKRGLRVASIKHAHDSFQIDEGETDSARHRRAGAPRVAVVSRHRWAMITELDEGEPEPDFADVAAAIGPADLIVVEGYKSAPIPKVEARRSKSVTRRPLAPDDPNIIAIASDHNVGPQSVPVFELDDVATIADFILAKLNKTDEAQQGAAVVVDDDCAVD